MELGQRFKLAILLALLCASILPCGALAENCGNFIITVNDGKPAAESYHYDAGGILTVYAGADVTISSAGNTARDRLILGAQTGGHTGRTKVTLNGLTTQFSDGGDENGAHKTALPNNQSGTPAVLLDANADVVLKLADGSENAIKSGTGRAGIYVPETSALEIQGPGKLEVEGGLSGAGIGGDAWTDAGSIIISEGAVIVATSGKDGAAIGGGHANDVQNPNHQKGYVKSIVIKDSVVIAKSTLNGAAIGTGCWYQNLSGREAPEIIIENSIVKASTQEGVKDGPVNAIGNGFHQMHISPVMVDIKNSVIVAKNEQDVSYSQTLPRFLTVARGSSIIANRPPNYGNWLSAHVVTLTGNFTMPDGETVELNGNSILKVNGSLHAPDIYSLTLSGAELKGQTDGTYYFQAGKPIELKVAAQIQDSFLDWETTGLMQFQTDAGNTLTFTMPANAVTVTAKRVPPSAPSPSPSSAPSPSPPPPPPPPRTGDDRSISVWLLSMCGSLVAALGLLIGRKKRSCR